jgi:hypothetical protein
MINTMDPIGTQWAGLMPITPIGAKLNPVYWLLPFSRGATVPGRNDTQMSKPHERLETAIPKHVAATEDGRIPGFEYTP